VILAVAGARTRRNALAVTLTTAGVALITQIRITGEPLGFAFAFGNRILFMLYVILGHRIANSSPAGATGGIDRLAAAMLIAAVAATPFGLGGTLPAFGRPMLLLAGAGVGVCSSVIPYITDQLAMARLPRATFALMLALLPMFATLMGAIVLHQIPTAADLAGITLVVAGVAVHRPPADRERKQRGVCEPRVCRDAGVPDLPGRGISMRTRPSRWSRARPKRASPSSTPPTPIPAASPRSSPGGC
jgi:inner membrane transporter RhtA